MGLDPKFSPLVSIVIPVFNGADFMRQAIDSALTQTYRHIEVLVINDGSNDGGQTAAIARSYGKRIRYFSQPNGGVACALNRGIREMKGEYFSWLSHDDLYQRNKIARQISGLARRKDREVMLYSDYRLIDARGGLLEKRRIGKEHTDNQYLLILATRLNGCTLLIPKSIFDRIGLFNERLKTTQDNEMWLRIAKSGIPFVHQARLLVCSRVHPNQGNVRWRDVHRREKERFFFWAKGFLKEEAKRDPRIRALIADKLAAFRSLRSLRSRGSEPAVHDPRCYWDRLLTERFDETGVCRHGWPRRYNRWLHRQQKRTFKRLLAHIAFDPGTAEVVEIGPGIGFWTEQFSAMGVERYRAFDISATAVKRLRQRFPDYEFVAGDFSDHRPTTKEKKSFSLALGVLVFLHVTDNRKFRRCWRILSQMLKPNAFLIVLDAVAVNPLRGHHQSIGDGAGFNPAMHNKVRYLADYQRIAAAAGFSLQKTIPAFTLTQPGFDYASPFAFRFWNFFFRCLQKILAGAGEKQGHLLGALLYFLDGWVTPLTGKGISSKWLVFRKTG